MSVDRTRCPDCGDLYREGRFCGACGYCYQPLVPTGTPTGRSRPSAPGPYGVDDDPGAPRRPRLGLP